jgi:[ribosomal protein S18]-alanine N-acetyltransferase
MKAPWRKADGRDGPGDAEPFRLRALVRNDLQAVQDLEHELFPDDSWTPEMFREELLQPPGTRLYLAAENGRGQLIGYAGMLFAPDRTADVLTIAVRPDQWGHGVGSALLGALTGEADRRGNSAVLLEVREDNPRARTLYRNRGFEEIGVRRGYYQPSGTDAIVMRKELR